MPVSALANATLTLITGPPAVDGYGNTADGGLQPLWTGRARGYLKRAKRSSQSNDVERSGATDTFTILDSAGAPAVARAAASWDASRVTIDNVVFRVLGMEHRQAGTTVDSVKLNLDREL